MATVTVIKHFFRSKEEAITDIKNEGFWPFAWLDKPGDSFEPHCHANDERLYLVDAATLSLWRRAVDRGFGWPSYGAEDLGDNLAHFLRIGVERPFTAYVAVSGEEAVASSLVFFGAGVAGIYHVTTVPEHRGRGLGSVITATSVVEARSRGYQIAVLHATEMGYPVYRRLGFEQVCDIGMRLRLKNP